MTTAERRILIIKMLHEDGVASVAKLSEVFDVSEVTIRKDLTVLEEQGHLVRTHGGAILHDHYLYDLPREAQANLNSEKKERIGKAAAGILGDIDNALLGAGSTTLAVARHLKGKRRLTVGTNSVSIAYELINNLEIELFMLGGQVNHATSSVIGAQAEQSLVNTSFSWLFLGTDGFDIDYGLTTTNINEARLDQAMIEASQKVVLVADSTKFGRRGLSLVCAPNRIAMVITDDGLDDRFRSYFDKLDIELILV